MTRLAGRPAATPLPATGLAEQASLRCLKRWALPLVLALCLGACEPAPQAPAAVAGKHTAAAANEAEAARFLQNHWARPLAAQGPLPTTAGLPAVTLAPQSCATCHAAQFEDWGHSLHSRAMGPGMLGQLMDMPAQARDEHQACIRCHAPLAEQADSLVAALEAPAGKAATAAPLHEQGLVCAACHVRKGEWYGPPRRDGSRPAGDMSALPHGGWKASTAFESSQFCAACHQFQDDEYSLNGKLLENTYKEWQTSRHAREGVTCQSCHMPERRHLWRGIHDPEMVKQGVEIRADDAAVVGAQVAARLSVRNTGVGHHFPTYVTPKVVVRGVQLDASAKRLPGTQQEFIIARLVSMDLSREIADTRIAADAKADFDYRQPRHARAVALLWEVEVQPDAFYFDFHVSWLRDNPAGRGRAQIAQARDAARASRYIVFARRLAWP